VPRRQHTQAREDDVAKKKDKQRDWEEKVGEKQVGQPFSTERELVEQGKSREGTNLDLGEERSPEQEREIEELEENREG
jgi:hypothetical protein